MIFSSLEVVFLLLQIVPPSVGAPNEHMDDLQIENSSSTNCLSNSRADKKYLDDLPAAKITELQNRKPRQPYLIPLPVLDKIGAVRVFGNYALPRAYILWLFGLKADDDLHLPFLVQAHGKLWLRPEIFDRALTHVVVVESSRGPGFKDIEIHVYETADVLRLNNLAIYIMIANYEIEYALWRVRRDVRS